MTTHKFRIFSLLIIIYKYILFIKNMLILYKTKLDFITYSNKKQFFYNFLNKLQKATLITWYIPLILVAFKFEFLFM